MEFKDQLTDIKKKVMKKIEEAATAQNARLISVYSAMAIHIEEDERTLAALEKRLIEYDEQLRKMNQPDLKFAQSEIIMPTDSRQIKINGKQLAPVARRKLIEAFRTHGYYLQQVKRTIYRGPSGRQVAFAFSNESKQKPNYWFLGVPDAKDLYETYETIVLQCCRRNGELLQFRIPGEDLATFWPSLSRNGGQVKFNVVRDGEGFYFSVPGFGRQSIDRFRVPYGPSNKRECVEDIPIAIEV